MAGDIWADPIHITGESGSQFIASVVPFTGVYKIIRWSGTYVPYRRLIFNRTPDWDSYSQIAYKNMPAGGGGSSAATSGQGYISDLRWGPSISWVPDQATGFFYIQALLMNNTGATVDFTYEWDFIAPPPSRPYSWEDAEDISTEINAAGDYFELEYDNVAQGYLERRHYLFTVPDGTFIRAHPDTPEGYFEFYYGDTDPYDEYITYGYNDPPDMDYAEVTATGGRPFMLYIDAYGLTPPDTAKIIFEISEPVDPPAYVVSNDNWDDALPMDLDSSPFSYDNTGATEDSTVPLYLYTEEKRSIWYDVDPQPTVRHMRFTPIPSLPGDHYKPNIYIFAYDTAASPGNWAGVEMGFPELFPVIQSPTTARIPAGKAIKVLLSFPHGNQGLWETAGQLVIDDLAPLLPEDSDPATPSPAAATTITFPDLGGLTVNRHMEFVADGSLYNLILGSATTAPWGYAAANILYDGVYVMPVAARSTASPTALTQIRPPAGTVVTIQFRSRFGVPVFFNMGTSTEEDRNTGEWQNADYNRPDGFSNWEVLPPWYNPTTGPIDLNVIRWHKTASDQEDVDNVEEREVGPLDGMQSGVYTAVTTNIPWTDPGSPSGCSSEIEGRALYQVIIIGPREPGYTDLYSEATISFITMTFQEYFDDDGKVVDPAPYFYNKWWPAIQWYEKYQSELPTMYQGLGFAQRAEMFNNGVLQIEWSEAVGDEDHPYNPLVSMRRTGSVTASINGPTSGGMAYPLSAAVDYLIPYRSAYRRFVSDEAAADWAHNPALTDGTTIEAHGVLGAMTETVSSEYSNTTLVDDEIEDHYTDYYAFWVSSENLASAAPVNAASMEAFARANPGFPIGWFWRITNSAGMAPGVSLQYASQFRVSWFNERFGEEEKPVRKNQRQDTAKTRPNRERGRNTQSGNL